MSIREHLDKGEIQWANQVVEKIHHKLTAVRERSATKLPAETNDGVHDDKLTAKGNIGIAKGFWTNGFWAGMLWQMYHATKDERYAEIARFTLPILDECLLELDTHDIGFLWLPTAVLDYTITGSAAAKQSALTAGKWLMGRFNPAIDVIRAWGGGNEEMALSKTDPKMHLAGVTIIDCMMNLPLLYWASQELDDPRFYKIAVSHAKTAQRYIVRPDGSCNHIVAFDPDTGEYLNSPGGQGFGQGSSWSRGQSWAVYGFALSYRHTKDPDFLDTAKRCAHYCIANMAVTDWLPLVDYRQPAQPVKYDSTAAVITACGLLEIAGHVGENEARFYTEAAYRILRACEGKFADWEPQRDSILTGGTYFYHDPTGENTEVPIIYADYFFIEAVLRLKGKELFEW